MAPLLHEVVARALAGNAEEVAIEFNGTRIRWGYLQQVASRLDAVLSEAGLGPQSPIGLVPRNRPAFAAALLSLLAARRSIVMVYAFQSPAAIANDLAPLSLPAVIADAEDWTHETRSALAQGAMGIALSADVAAADPLCIVGGDSKGHRADLRGPTAAPVIELLTSGTTGRPKRLPTLYETIARAVILGSVLDAGEAAGVRGDPGTVNFPLSNISGIYSYLPMAVARRLVLLMEKFNVMAWADFVKRHRPRVVVLPPAGVRMLLDARVPPADLAGVRYLSVGTAALDPATHQEFEACYGIPILLSYGATEFAGAATTMTAELHAAYGRAKFGSVGKPSGPNEVRVIDPVDRRVLPPGEVGVLEVKVPMLGEKFITTTDLGMIDEDGFVFIRGRVDGVIMRGGFKILPSAVEAALNRFPGVAASCVIGVPDARLGQVPAAAVEMLAGAAEPTAAALAAHLRMGLPATHIPVAFRVVRELPRTPSLKIDLTAVRALFQRGTPVCS